MKLIFDFLKFEILQTRFNNFLYKISKKDIAALIIIASIALLNYGHILTSYLFNNDGLIRINSDSFFTFYSYIERGRWAYAFIHYLYNPDAYIPAISGAISIVLILITIVLAWRLFEIKGVIAQTASGALFLSFPILIYFFFYTGDIEVYATGMAFMVLSFLIFKSTNHSFNIWSIALNTVALASYPALFSFMATIVIAYSLLKYLSNKNVKTTFNVLFKGALISLTSLILYFVITKYLLWVFDLNMTTYRNADSITMMGLIEQLPEHFIKAFELFVYIFITQETSVKVVLMLLVGLFLYHLGANENVWYKRILIPIIWLILFIISIFATYFITYDSYYYTGFIFGVLIFLLILAKVVLYYSTGVLKTITILLIGFMVFKHIQNNNVIIYTHELNIESAKTLAENIIYDVQKLPNYNMKNTPIVVFGAIQNNPHFNFKSTNGDVIIYNDMEFPVGFQQNKQYNLKYILRIYFQDANLVETTSEMISKVKDKYKESNNYPAIGSVFLESDTVFVKLGE